MEYNKGRQFNQSQETKQEYIPVAYGALQINNYDGTIKYGTFEIDLYKPPINLQKRNPSDLLKTKVKLTIA